MSTNITFKGNAILFFSREAQAHSQALLFFLSLCALICGSVFFPIKHHASSFEPKKSVVALGIEAIDKNKAILERMVEYKNYSQTSV